MNDYPVIKFTLLFAIGILLQHILKLDIQIIYYFIPALVLFLISFYLGLLKNISLTKQFLISLLIILFGISVSTLNKNTTKELPEKLIHKKGTVIYGKIINVSLIQNDKVKFIIATDSVLTSRFSLIGNLNLQSTFKGDKNNLVKFYNSIYPGYKIKIAASIYNARDRRNPGEFNYKKYLKSKGISGIINLKNKNQIKIIDKNKNFYSSFVFSIRKEIANKIDDLYSPKASSLLKGLLLADRSNISYTTKEEFINAGVIHILAVSGLHVGFIAMIVIIFLGRINLFIRSILTIISLFLFLIITGAPPSVLRAVIMGTVIIVSFMFVKGTNIFNSLAIAALIILLLKPQQLFSPGFQLSFSAVLGIAVIYPIFRNFLNKININNNSVKNILLFMGVSIGAQIGTLPFTLIYFGKLSLVALVINLFIIPLVGIIIATGIASLLLGIILPSIAIYYAYANELFSNIMFGVISAAANLNYSFIKISHFNFYDAIIFYFFLLFIIFIRRKITNIFPLVIILLLIVFNIFLLTSFFNKELLPPNKLSILMIDVGQGDAILVKYPNGKISLIDAGIRMANFDNGKYTIEPLLNYLGIDKIDYAFVSHMDIDHYGGFNYLIKKGFIKRIIKPEYDSTLSKDVRFEKLISKKKLNEKYYKQKIIKENNLRIYILNNSRDPNYKGLSSNNKSGIIKIVYGNTSILFTGDIENLGEKYYSNYYKKFLKSDVLKVAHHGSKTSSTEEFINYVKPKYSLISVGKFNKYRHPSYSVVSRLKEYKSKIYRTDNTGALLFQSDGIKFKEINWRD